MISFCIYLIQFVLSYTGLETNTFELQVMDQEIVQSRDIGTKDGI